MTGSALALLPVQAWAQPVELAEADQAGQPAQVMTVTATRAPRPLDEVPATVTVIDEERIADELASDVRDLIRYEPGVSVPRQPARFGAALGVTGRDQNSGFRIRGIGGNRVLIQVDGVRVPDGFTFGAQAAGRGDYVDLGIVKSVEILRGPASALYGSDGLAGAVTFVTSDPGDLIEPGRNFAAMARAAYDGSTQEFAETALVAGQAGQWSGLLSYTRRDGQELDNEGTVGGQGSTRTQPNPTDTHANSVLGRLVFQPNDNHRFRLTAEYGDTYTFTDVLTGRTASVLDLYAEDTTERSRVSFDWRYNSEGTLRFAQIAAYLQDGQNYQYTFEDRNPAVDRTRINTFDNRVIGASGEARLAFATGSIRHNVVFGGDISVTTQEGLRDGTIPPAGEVFPTRAFPVTDFTLAGLFITDEIELFDGAVTLFPALRFDSFSLDPENDPLLPAFQGAAQDGSRVTPRFGIVGQLGGGVSLYGNYASGFKAPAPTQVNQFFENLAFGYTSRPNPDLGPETSETFEAGIRYNSGIFNASLSAFTGTYDDFISQEVVDGSFTPADPAVYQFINLDGVKISGVEGRASLNHDSGITANLAFAYAEGETIEPGNVRVPLGSIDPLKIVGGVGYRDPRGRFGAQLTGTYNARKELSETTGVCGANLCFRPDESFVVDLTGHVRVGEHITLRAGVFNLTDQRYSLWSDVAGIAAPANPATSNIDAYTNPGRHARVSVTFRY